LYSDRTQTSGNLFTSKVEFLTVTHPSSNPTVCVSETVKNNFIYVSYCFVHRLWHVMFVCKSNICTL